MGGASAGAVDEWLISPMRFLSPSDRGLQFYWLGNRTWAAQANATCLIRPQGAGSWTTLWSLLNEGSGQEFQYHQRVVDVSSWLGDSVQIAFRVTGTNGADFAVDDVSTGNLAAFPVAPANAICASATTLPTRRFEFGGSTCNASNNLNPYHANSLSCASDDLSGGDVFYRFNAAAGDTIDANVASDWQAALYIMSSCDTAVTSCVAASQVLELADTSSVATLHYVFASGGTYYLGVDGVGGECGDFHLTGNFRGPTTGVEDGSSQTSSRTLRALPNPTTGAVLFSGNLLGSTAAEGTLTIFDPAGRRVWQTRIHAGGGRFFAGWDGRAKYGQRAPSGTYLARADFSGRLSVTAHIVLLE